MIPDLKNKLINGAHPKVKNDFQTLLSLSSKNFKTGFRDKFISMVDDKDEPFSYTVEDEVVALIKCVPNVRTIDQLRLLLDIYDIIVKSESKKHPSNTTLPEDPLTESRKTVFWARIVFRFVSNTTDLVEQVHKSLMRDPYPVLEFISGDFDKDNPDDSPEWIRRYLDCAWAAYYSVYNPTCPHYNVPGRICKPGWDPIDAFECYKKFCLEFPRDHILFNHDSPGKKIDSKGVPSIFLAYAHARKWKRGDIHQDERYDFLALPEMGRVVLTTGEGENPTEFRSATVLLRLFLAILVYGHNPTLFAMAISGIKAIPVQISKLENRLKIILHERKIRICNKTKNMNPCYSFVRNTAVTGGSFPGTIRYLIILTPKQTPPGLP